MLSEANREQIFDLINDNHSTVDLDWHSITDTVAVQIVYGDQEIQRSLPTIALEWRGIRNAAHGKLGDHFIAQDVLAVVVSAANYDKDDDPSTGDEIPGQVIARQIIADILYQAENNWNTTLTGLTPKIRFIPPVQSIAGQKEEIEDRYVYSYIFLMNFEYNIDVTQTV